MKTRFFWSLAPLGLVLLLAAGCTPSRVKWDKAAMLEVKKAAVVVYTVPISIQYRDDPKESKKSMLQMAAAVANTNNGGHAATLAADSFAQALNAQKLSFSVLSMQQETSNPSFNSLLQKTTADIAAAKAKMASQEAKQESGMSKALGFLGSLSKATGSNPYHEGAGPDGFPEFGLAPEWTHAPSALMGAPGEKEYIKAAIAALGVDAAIVVNDMGMSFGCTSCVGGTGSGTTGSAFLVTFVDKDGEEILQMRQWFAIGGAQAAMVGYVVNPLQHDSLFKGHGEKMARVFADYYREEGGK